MKFKLGAAVLAATLAVSTYAYANPDVIKLRDGLMRQNGQAMKILVTMARGNMDFDAGLAKGVFSSLAGMTDGYGLLFPAGSEEGETKAGPQIFSDPDGFAEALGKFKADAEAAVAAVEANGLEGLQASLGTVGGHCQSCHKDWRKP